MAIPPTWWRAGAASQSPPPEHRSAANVSRRGRRSGSLPFIATSACSATAHRKTPRDFAARETAAPLTKPSGLEVTLCHQARCRHSAGPRRSARRMRALLGPRTARGGHGWPPSNLGARMRAGRRHFGNATYRELGSPGGGRTPQCSGTLPGFRKEAVLLAKFLNFPNLLAGCYLAGI